MSQLLAWKLVQAPTGRLLIAAALGICAHTRVAESRGAEPNSALSAEAVPVGHWRNADCNCAGCRAYFDACGIPCPPGAMAPSLSEPYAGDELGGAARPGDVTGEQGDSAPVTFPTGIQPGMGAIAASTSAAPNMIGDAFGGSGFQTVVVDNDDSGLFGATLPLISPGRAVGIQKMADNSSPLPQDRFIYNYDYFNNAALGPFYPDVNRHTFGIEKTFLDQTTSVEVRVPIASTLSSDLTQGSGDALLGNTNTQLGDVTFYFKALLHSTPCTQWGAGLGLSIPTADDLSISDDTEEVLRVENESVRLMPYIGFAHRVGSRGFLSAFAQYETTVAGSPVINTAFGGSEQLGEIEDASLMFVDVSSGYWIYKERGCRGITGVAPVVEYHWNQMLGDSSAPVNNFLYSDPSGSDSVGVHNMVFGTVLELGGRHLAQLAYVAPISGDREFDGEFRFSLNWYYGARAIAPMTR